MEHRSGFLLRNNLFKKDFVWTGSLGRDTRHAVFSACTEETHIIQQDCEHIIQDEEFDFKNVDIQG